MSRVVNMVRASARGILVLEVRQPLRYGLKMMSGADLNVYYYSLAVNQANLLTLKCFAPLS